MLREKKTYTIEKKSYSNEWRYFANLRCFDLSEAMKALALVQKSMGPNYRLRANKEDE